MYVVMGLWGHERCRGWDGQKGKGDRWRKEENEEDKKVRFRHHKGSWNYMYINISPPVWVYYLHLTHHYISQLVRTMTSFCR